MKAHGIGQPQASLSVRTIAAPTPKSKNCTKSSNKGKKRTYDEYSSDVQDDEEAPSGKGMKQEGGAKVKTELKKEDGIIREEINGYYIHHHPISPRPDDQFDGAYVTTPKIEEEEEKALIAKEIKRDFYEDQKLDYERCTGKKFEESVVIID